MAAFTTQAPVLPSKSGTSAFIECQNEIIQSAVIDLKNLTTHTVGTTWQGLGLFVPTYMFLIGTDVSGVLAQPAISFMGNGADVSIAATDDFFHFQLLSGVRKTAIAEGGTVSFSVADTDATTYSVVAFVGGFYTRM